MSQVKGWHMGMASRRKRVRRFWRDETGRVPGYIRLLAALTRGLRRGAVRMRVAVAVALGPAWGAP